MIDSTWTLFLDRDGIINKRIIDGYVKEISQFVFKSDFIQAMPILNRIFKYTIVVTNQQGIEKELVTESEVATIHAYLINSLKEKNIKIDKIYLCPHLAERNCNCRKPNIGMALNAKKEFPDIDFNKSVMIGDSISDLIFGKNLNMKTVFIADTNNYVKSDILAYADFFCADMMEFTNLIR